MDAKREFCTYNIESGGIELSLAVCSSSGNNSSLDPERSAIATKVTSDYSNLSMSRDKRRSQESGNKDGDRGVHLDIDFVI